MTEYMHQIPFEMWGQYVEGSIDSVKSICGKDLKPEIPLNEKLPRCPECWPTRWTKPPEPMLAKKYTTKPYMVEAIHVSPTDECHIYKVLEWGEQNGAKMTWLGVDRGLHVEVEGRTFEVEA